METIYVGNLPYDTDEESLAQFFNPFGEIKRIKIVHDSDGKSRGFGFVTFFNEIEAKHALSMGGRYFHGRKLYLKIAHAKEYPVIQPN